MVIVHPAPRHWQPRNLASSWRVQKCCDSGVTEIFSFPYMRSYKRILYAAPGNIFFIYSNEFMDLETLKSSIYTIPDVDYLLAVHYLFAVTAAISIPGMRYRRIDTITKAN